MLRERATANQGSSSMAILVTGSAGFIGSHVSHALLARGEQVIGVDNLNSYYDPALKRARLERLQGKPGFSFEHADIADLAPRSGLRIHPPRESQEDLLCIPSSAVA
jgi:UDP-glucuronate 4-epimerase